MIKGMVNAVAALLYNEIYNLTPDEGAWTKEDPRDDQSYLAFARQLVQALEGNPDMSNDDIIQVARHAVDTRKCPIFWDTIHLGNDEYSSLTAEADRYLPIIRHLIEEQPPIYFETEFLEYNEEGNYIIEP